MTYRIVADTNILVSATFWGGQPQRIMTLAKDGRVTLLTTPELMDELNTGLSGSGKELTDEVRKRLTEKDRQAHSENLL